MKKPKRKLMAALKAKIAFEVWLKINRIEINALQYSVMAGLVPAIHAKPPAKRQNGARGRADKVRA
jgi:hypothetical protein